MQAYCALECHDAHGEGIFWSAAHGLLYWTDIFGERLWTRDPATNASQSWRVPGKVCCFADRAGRPWNQLIGAFADGFALFDILSGERRDIAPFEPHLESTRLNDGRTDRQGRLIAGGMDEAALAPISSVWRLDADLSVTMLFDGVGCANGICFSPDGRTLWFADSPTKTIDAFDYDTSSGNASNRRTVAHVPAPGVPDGSCVDAQGFVWNAVWEGYRVERRSPDGRLDRVVDVPVKKPTCCAFGGAQLDTLFITSSRLGETPEDLLREPLAGSLFAVTPGVRGLADQPFAG